MNLLYITFPTNQNRLLGF